MTCTIAEWNDSHVFVCIAKGSDLKLLRCGLDVLRIQ